MRNPHTKIYILTLLAIILGFVNVWLLAETRQKPVQKLPEGYRVAQPVKTQTPSTSNSSLSVPSAYQINGLSHSFQTFNNCGPASLSMALSAFGINVSQKTLGDEIRPYQIASGDNDDKSVTLEELAEKSRDFGFVPYHRPNGDLGKLKAFVANGMPVIARTDLELTSDIGHYRVVYGYDDSQNVVLQNDSYQGKELRFEYDLFSELWKTYGYEYLVLVPQEKQKIAEKILGADANEQVAWQNSLERLNSELSADPDNTKLLFARAVVYYQLNRFEDSVNQFKEVEGRIPFRTLWYQIEPLLAFQKLKRYDELLPRVENILSNHNRAFSELYQIRGEIYLEQGKVEDAKREFELAVLYNKNYEPAIRALADLR